MSQPLPDKPTILIVDDTPENLSILKGALSDDYAVRLATNGHIALRAVSITPQPDLILLDIMMPGIDGYEICRRLKADPSTQHIPVIFVTAMSKDTDELMGLRTGAIDYITKPFSIPIVQARVKTHILLNNQKRLLENQVAERTEQLQKRNRELDERTEQLQRRNRELEETRLEMIRQLGRAAEYRDNETGMHVIRMSHYVRLLAIESGYGPADAEQLMYAAMMHDIGKIGIPDHTLLKPGKLTDEEFEIIKTHPEIGYQIIGQQSSELLQKAATIAYTHHEKWNGRGYPQGLCGAEIPIEGRMTAIADVFDALTCKRPYKEPWPVDRALELIANETGEHFDPILAPLFIQLKPALMTIMEQHQDGE
ncbi:MAG: two-component system response regulator [Magnetococcales bacterium]|nr:two-component system response regulator [Magnetococcales bacterium]